MRIDSNFVFRVNVSNDSYMTKSEASACLSRAGAEAVGKVKMAFREKSLTVDQFLQRSFSKPSLATRSVICSTMTLTRSIGSRRARASVTSHIQFTVRAKTRAV